MKRKPHFSEDRHQTRLRRACKALILDMHRESLRCRAAQIDYEHWTKTPEYQQEVQRIRGLIAEIKEDQEVIS